MATAKNNLFCNARVVAANVDPAAYFRQAEGVGRGHRQYTMSRGELCACFACPEKWLTGAESDDTEATRWGTWLECKVFDQMKRLAVQPETYSINVMECPSCGSQTDSKTCKKCGVDRVEKTIRNIWSNNASFCREWNKEHAGKIRIKPDELERVSDAEKRLLADPISSELIARSQKQVMVVGEYHDEANELIVPVKSLIDLVPELDFVQADLPIGKSLADLKTSESVHPRGWSRKVFSYGWHVQAAMELELYTAATGEDRDTFFHVCQESKRPWQPGHEILSLEHVQLGRQTLLAALRCYAECVATGHWPNYAGMQLARERIGPWSLCAPEDWMITAAMSW